MGHEILYCSRCRAQLRGREFEKGDAFRIDDQAVCKGCAPELVKSLPPDKVQILLKQMVTAQGKTPPKTARSTSAPPPAPGKTPDPVGAAPAVPRLTPLWIGLGLTLTLVLGLAIWVIGGFGHPPPTPPVVQVPAPRVEPATTPPRDPVIPPISKPSGHPEPAKTPAADPKSAKPPDPPPGPTVPGLVGYWKLDEGAGITVADASGFGGSGTLLGGPTWVPGKHGTALSFNGTGNVLNVQAGSALNDLMKSGLTVSAWIYPRALKRGHLVDKSNANVGWILSFKSDARIQFSGDQYAGSELSRFSSKPLAVNSWYHVAATWDGDRSASHAHLYVNGVLADADGKDGGGNVREGSSPILSIGNRRALDRGFDGMIDDVRIYSRVLSPAEILSQMNGTPR